MKKRSLLICLLACLVAFSAFMFVGCNGDTVSISKTSIELNVGDSKTISATSSSEGATITWKSENEEVADVSENGTITARSKGTTNIVATGNSGTAKCEVTVNENANITISKSSIDGYVGDSYLLIITKNTDADVVWATGNATIATVTDGLVNLVSAGSTTITATVGNTVKTCEVTISEVPYSISAVSKIYVGKGLTKTVEAKLMNGAQVINGINFAFESKDASKLTVTGNTVKGVDVGTTKVVASCVYQGNLSSAKTFTKEIEVEIIPTIATDIVCYDGNGAPKSLGDAEEGDLYLDKVNGRTYVVENGAWKLDKLIRSAEGNQNWITGTTSPKGSAKTGALYLNLTNGNIYEYDAGWEEIMNFFEDLYIGKGDPSNRKAAIKGESDYDLYLDVETYNVYMFEDDVWSLVVNITNNNVYITLNKTETTVGTAGDAKFDQLSAFIDNPISGVDVFWISDDSDIVTVDATGKITGVSAGTTSVTARYASVEAKCEITVEQTEVDFLTEVSVFVDKTVSIIDLSKFAGKTVTFTSSNGTIASVDANGVVTGKKAGQAQITAEISGEEERYCLVTVKKVITVSLNKTAISLLSTDGAYDGLIVTTNYEDALVWTSSNEDVATVDSTGKITPVSNGVAYITVNAGGKIAICSVEVKLETVVSLQKTELKISNKSSDTLVFTVENAENPIVWESTDTTVATIESNGLVTALKEGSCFITVSTTQETTTHGIKEYYAQIVINVLPEEIQEEEITDLPDEYLVKGGKTVYKIVVADDCETEELTAAKEIANFMKEATGATFNIVKESTTTFSANAKYIYVGKTNEAATRGITCTKAEVKYTGYKLVTKAKSIFLVGASARGTLYGAYDLLEILVDFEEYSYDELYFRKTDTVNFQNFNIKFIPTIETNYANMDYITGNATVAHRMRACTEIETFVKFSGKWCHTCETLLSYSSYGKAHPEWFSTSGNQWCFSTLLEDEEMYSIMMKNFVSGIRQNPNGKYASISQNDVFDWCSCAKCTTAAQKYGSNLAVCIMAANKIANDIETNPDYADLKARELYIHLFSYHKTSDAITFVDDAVMCNPRVNVMFAPIRANYTKSWEDSSNSVFKLQFDTLKNICSHISVWAYDAHFPEYFVCYNTFSDFQNRIQTMSDSNVAFAFDQTPALTYQSFSVMKCWLWSKLCWNNSLNMEQLISEFCDHYYKACSEEIQAYLESYRLWSLQAYALGMQTDINGSNFVNSAYWPQGVLLEWIDMLDSAIENDEMKALKVTDPATYDLIRTRVLRESLTARYLLIQLYESTYSSTEAYAMKIEFRKICGESHVLAKGEQRSLSDVWASWGI